MDFLWLLNLNLTKVQYNLDGRTKSGFEFHGHTPQDPGPAACYPKWNLKFTHTDTVEQKRSRKEHRWQAWRLATLGHCTFVWAFLCAARRPTLWSTVAELATQTQNEQNCRVAAE